MCRTTRLILSLCYYNDGTIPFDTFLFSSTMFWIFLFRIRYNYYACSFGFVFQSNTLTHTQAKENLWLNSMMISLFFLINYLRLLAHLLFGVRPSEALLLQTMIHGLMVHCWNMYFLCATLFCFVLLMMIVLFSNIA